MESGLRAPHTSRRPGGSPGPRSPNSVTSDTSPSKGCPPFSRASDDVTRDPLPVVSPRPILRVPRVDFGFCPLVPVSSESCPDYPDPVLPVTSLLDTPWVVPKGSSPRVSFLSFSGQVSVPVRHLLSACLCLRFWSPSSAKEVGEGVVVRQFDLVLSHEFVCLYRKPDGLYEKEISLVTFCFGKFTVMLR